MTSSCSQIIRLFLMQPYIFNIRLGQKTSVVLHWRSAQHTHSGLEYQSNFWIKRKLTIWKPRQMRIWVRTEKRRGTETRPEGGLRATSSFHAEFKLTRSGWGKRKKREITAKRINNVLTISGGQ